MLAVGFFFRILAVVIFRLLLLPFLLWSPVLLPLRLPPALVRLCRFMHMRYNGFFLLGMRNGPRHFYKRMIFFNSNFFTNQLLDIAQVRSLFHFAERVGPAAGTRPTGSANAVHVGFGDIGQIVVEHKTEVVNIDTAGSNICGHQYAGFACLKILQSLLSGILAFVAMNGFGALSGLNQIFHNAVGAMFGTVKHQQAVNIASLLQQMQQQVALVCFADIKKLLLYGVGGTAYRRHFHFYRLVQNGLRQFGNFSRHGGAEQQGLPFGGQFGYYLFYIVYKTHVQHAVGFVEHKNL